MNISVIIPVYNTNAVYLNALLTSLLKLNKDNFEVVIVDDCSTDKSTIDIFNQFKKFPNFNVIKNEKNGGVSFSRNAGIRASKFEFLCFIDSDDLVNVDLLNQVAFKDLDFDLALFKRKYIDNKTLVVNENDSNLKIFENKVLFKDIFCARSAPKEYKDYALRGVRCKILKKDFLIKNKISFDEELRQYEDTIFIAELIKNEGKVLFFDNFSDFYRIDRKSLSHHFNKNYENNFKLYFKKFSEKFSNNLDLMDYFYYSAFATYMPLRSWVTFKKFRWVRGIKFIKEGIFVSNHSHIPEANNKLIKIKNKYAKKHYISLYFYLNFKHLLGAIFK
ncbi:MAG: glycosyltransferase [Bacteroidales bacterium]|nr:glycosyltransferase [Bacteroidales bacterium]